MRELLRDCDARELIEWRAFDGLAPIGHRRGDWQTALLCAVTANAQRAGGTAAKTSDFLLEFVSPDDEGGAATSLEGIKSALTQMAGLANEAHAEGTAVERGVAASAAREAAKKTKTPRGA